MYAERGARVCLTGRREEEARRVGEECEVVRGVSASARGIEERGQAGKEGGTGERVIGVGADFTDAGVMVGLRERLERGLSCFTSPRSYPKSHSLTHSLHSLIN